MPDPLGPVITTSRSRGNDTSMFFRLCSRAPRTTTRPFIRARDSRQPLRQRDRRHHAARIRRAGARRVVRHAVVDARAHERQAPRDVHRQRPVQQLRSDRGLIVQHRDHGVDLARCAWRNTVSAPTGPSSRSLPSRNAGSARASAIAGAIARGSSSPNRPASPACGLSPVTTMRGARRVVRQQAQHGLGQVHDRAQHARARDRRRQLGDRRVGRRPARRASAGPRNIMVTSSSARPAARAGARCGR